MLIAHDDVSSNHGEALSMLATTLLHCYPTQTFDPCKEERFIPMAQDGCLQQDRTGTPLGRMICGETFKGCGQMRMLKFTQRILGKSKSSAMTLAEVEGLQARP